MEKIAVIIGHIYVYWSSIVMTLAGATAVCLFLALYLGKKRRLLVSLICIPLALALSLVLSRLAFWYFRPDSFDSLKDALNWRHPGGAALMGVFAGCILTAVVLWTLKLEKELPKLLDCMSIAGSFGIGLGRLASFFNTTDRGMILARDMGLPWVVPTMNPVSGAMECRLATFLLQAAAAGGIGLGLMVFSLTGKRKQGDAALLFLLFYGVSQVVLDSTRYDALYLRSNGFVSAVQVLAAVGIVAAAVAFGIRLVRSGGWKKWQALLWLSQASCLVVAGYMEYYVQRHGNEAVFAYSVMIGTLAGFLILTLVTRYLAGVEEKKHRLWMAQLSDMEKEGHGWKE